jgi:glucose-6-phosphate 1-dehydrogenase
MGMTVMGPGEKLVGQPAEMIATKPAGDATLFAREDYVEQAWRIVDPVLKKVTPVYPYDPGTWGPHEVERVTPPGGWQNPIVGHELSAVSGRAA